MKLIIQNNRIVATATNAYNGPDQFIDAPVDFDTEKISEYIYVDGAVIYPAAEINVSKAKALLLDSDWSDLPSVRNTAITPHLLNGDDFDAYRAALRTIVVSKFVVVEVWPSRPDAIWHTQLEI